ncbi:MSMEG_0565 family glycosyltransferase [Methylobacterium sp. NEAU 140]|uniref:MSMEG_0565 family glycosyltransferase n=1 Tax=Methylobacterium sp. NEAU 140 TaxID=3064945 RepID=UPI0027376D75|nr:MSMEG_0565 family glycosyltransferase [Methylobacterium sp. NEAU 140]MDP4022114.1 MSMEG_0565 family glycosyltransferase [Methylobacterium sp. NEAU 140]
MRIAILTPSTDPGGGVAHALGLAEALCGLGHEAVVHAPDPTGRGFFREARCPVLSVAAKTPSAEPGERIRAGIAACLAHFSMPAACDFDVFHAHCEIGGNALATLTRRRLIPGFVRTVHRVEAGFDPHLAPLRDRAILDAGRLLCASRIGVAALAAEYGASADPVGGGVDGSAYAPEPGPGDAELRRRLGLGAGPVFLVLGGFAAGKNALTAITAFAALRATLPSAQLVLAGAASGDHAGYAARCCAALEHEGLEVGPGKPVIRIGAVAQADMPALYRLADALVCPALATGYGLSVLESIACGTPAIVSARPPFTEYLRTSEALFVDPEDAGAVAAAMRASLEPERRRPLAAAARLVAGRHTWEACARRHLPAYGAILRVPPAVSAATNSAAWNTTRRPATAVRGDRPDQI